MKLPRRTFLQMAAGAAALPVLSRVARSQDYPTRPVTLIVPWATAGAVDTVARIAGPKLADRLGKPVVVENRPGGGSTIGTAAGAKAPTDGHTLGLPGSGRRRQRDHDAPAAQHAPRAAEDGPAGQRKGPGA